MPGTANLLIGIRSKAKLKYKNSAAGACREMPIGRLAVPALRRRYGASNLSNFRFPAAETRCDYCSTVMKNLGARAAKCPKHAQSEH